MNLLIERIELYIPETEVGISDIIKHEEHHPEDFETKEEYASFFTDFLGLSAVRVESVLSGLDMIKICMDRLFLDPHVKPKDIDLIVVAHDFPEEIQKTLGLHLISYYHLENANSVNLSGNQCANCEFAISFVHDIFRGNDSIKKAIIICCSKIKRDADRVLGSFGILGDAAGVLLVGNKQKNGKLKLIDKSLLSNTNLCEHQSEPIEVKCSYYKKCLSKIYINNSKPHLIRAIITPNANILLISQCFSEMGIDTDLIYTKNLSKYGHLDCIDFLVNINGIISDDTVVGGESIVSFGIGWTGSYAALLFEKI